MAGLNFVAALQHWHNASLSCLISDFLQLLRHPFVVKLCHSCVPPSVDWISFMGVESGRDKNEISFKLQQSREHPFCKFLSPLFWWSSGRENRHIKDSSWVNRRVIYTCVFITWASAWEKNSWVSINEIVKMDWSKKYIFAIIKIKPRFKLVGRNFARRKRRNVCSSDKSFRLNQGLDYFLSSIPMVNIKINDCYFFDFVTILAFQVSCSYCNIVYEAKTVAAGFITINVITVECFAEDASMMAWRSDRAKSIPKTFFHHGVYSLNHSTCSQQRRLPCLLTARSILSIKHRNLLVPTSFQLPDMLYHFQNVVEVMHFQNICYLRLLSWLSYLNLILQLLTEFCCSCKYSGLGVN